MTSSLTDLRPPPTRPLIPSRRPSKRPSTAGYWVAAVVAVLGLTAAVLWGAVGFSNTLDRVDGLLAVILTVAALEFLMGGGIFGWL